MRTHLTIYLNSEGARPTEVNERLLSLGFRPLHGQYDYAYDWDRSASVSDTIWFADKVHETLKGLGVTFTLETSS